MASQQQTITASSETKGLQDSSHFDNTEMRGSISPVRSLSEDSIEADTPISMFRNMGVVGSGGAICSNSASINSSLPLFPDMDESRDSIGDNFDRSTWQDKISQEIEEARKAAQAVTSGDPFAGEQEHTYEQLNQTLKNEVVLPIRKIKTPSPPNSACGEIEMARNGDEKDLDENGNSIPETPETALDEQILVSVSPELVGSPDTTNSILEEPELPSLPEIPNDIALSTAKSLRFAEKYSEEKKADQNDELRGRHARFGDGSNRRKDPRSDADPVLYRTLSVTESDVGSIDGLPSQLQSDWQSDEKRREKLLRSLDGVKSPPPSVKRNSLPPVKEAVRLDDGLEEDETTEMNFLERSIAFLWGSSNESADGTKKKNKRERPWNHQRDDSLGLLTCADIIVQTKVERPSPVPFSVVRVSNEAPPLSYAETINATEVDPRMQNWIESQFDVKGKPPADGAYYLGKSRTVIVHEIARGSWTWCTAWSADSNRLAVATEKHTLAIIDTSSSTVWKVIHDQLLSGPPRNHTTHSIRSIAWGSKYIAVGGTGNAVSILSSTSPYQVLHVIKGTGFVGSLHWNNKSNVLAIGSRLNKAIMYKVQEPTFTPAGNAREVESELLHLSGYKNWVNSVEFSPGGKWFAVGDAGGQLSIYRVVEAEDIFDVELLKSIQLDDSILALTWSPDGRWLYAGGEDRTVNVVDTGYWEVVHKVDTERWVQCMSCSNSGNFVAAGGVSSEISILDVKNGWESVMGIQLKGLVPLSARWSPKDRYLAVTGQNNSVLVIETTNARHVKGHHLRSISPIIAIEFSPDGRIAIIGNQNGVVTFFSLSGTTFVTAYELVATNSDSLSIQWSLNGRYALVGTPDSIIVVGRKKRAPNGEPLPPEASGYSVVKVIREIGSATSISIDFQSRFVAVCGARTRILDVTKGFAVVREFKIGPCLAIAWSPDGRWLATLGAEKLLTIYDTSEDRVDRWRPIFSLKCDGNGLSLSWCPLIVGGLLYLAYGGDNNEITIMEIRGLEGSWELVLRIPRDGSVNSLDWNIDGLLAAAIGNGTVSIVDLAYLQSGQGVNERDYNWQRQALTCFTEIRRNRGKNSMKTAKWIPSAPGSDSLLAVGGTDGEVEIVDLTERRRCRGYIRGA